jgi:hypothetical protein
VSSKRGGRGKNVRRGPKKTAGTIGASASKSTAQQSSKLTSRIQSPAHPKGGEHRETRRFRFSVALALMLGVPALFGMTVYEPIYRSPALIAPPVDPTDPLSLPFSIKNEGSFFTMHKMCGVAHIEAAKYEGNRNFIDDAAGDSLGDLVPGQTEPLHMRSGMANAGPLAKPITASIRFAVSYETDFLGFKFARHWDLGVCRWYFPSHGDPVWDCTSTERARPVEPYLVFKDEKLQMMTERRSLDEIARRCEPSSKEPNVSKD